MSSDPISPESGLEVRIVEHLRTVDAELQPLRSDLASIKDRSESRRRGLGPVVLAIVAAVAIGGVAWLVSTTRSEEVASTDVVESVAEPATEAPDAGGVAPPVAINADLEIDWDEHESPLGFFHMSAVSGSRVYVVSTAPGVRWTEELAFGGQLPQALYVSDNGKDWSTRILDEAKQISDLSAHDGVVYAIATSPGQVGDRRDDAPVIDLIRSEDDGATWAETSVTSTATPPSDRIRFQANTWSQVAAAEPGVVVVLSTHYWADFLALAPPEFRNPNQFFAEPRPDGVHVFDHTAFNEFDMCMQEQFEQFDEQFLALEQAGAEPEEFAALEEQMADVEARAVDACGVPERAQGPEEVAFVSWDDVGFDGSRESQVTETFFSADGVEFEPVESPALQGASLGELLVVGDRFLMTVFTDFGGSSVVASDDGITWEPLDLPGVDWVMTAGDIGGRMVLITQGRFGVGETLVSDDGGESWVRRPIGAGEAFEEPGDVAGFGPPDEERWLAQTAVGPIGAVAVYETFSHQGEQFGPSYEVFYSRDGLEWELAAESREPGSDEFCCPSLSGSAVTSDAIVVNVASSNSDAIPSFAFVGTPD